ncbi:MAG: ribonuclease P protein component [Candidatus Pacebacteria bacterium]|nr:ribonuclease P protein component [Candidatus Paceibacterota bacterium]
MLPSKNKIKSGFFKENKKPDFIKQTDSVSMKVYKTKKMGVSIITPKKIAKTAVERNSIKRKIFPLFKSVPKNTYIIYIKTNNLGKILDDIRDMV